MPLGGRSIEGWLLYVRIDYVRIDVHAHLWTAGYLDRLERLGKSDTGTQRGIGADATAADLDRRFALMDRAGIDLQSSCGPWTTSPTRGSPRRKPR
ncbi:hypothetical protein GCM10010317_088980 [Streptomyces mirabilis]|nr:hypothetical protein GCM10010317_088980 [Streptomyces mirabilis]